MEAGWRVTEHVGYTEHVTPSGEEGRTWAECRTCGATSEPYPVTPEEAKTLLDKWMDRHRAVRRHEDR